jgi:integrase/recombinase XerC
MADGSMPALIEEASTPVERDLLRTFLAGRTPSTLAAYSQDLDAFARFRGSIDARAAAADLVAQHHGEANGIVMDWRAAMVEQKLSPATINRRLAAVRSLVQVANVVGFIDWTLDVENVKRKAYRDTRGPGRVLFDAAVSNASAREDGKGVRDAALLRLLHDRGLRRQEVLALDLEDVDLDGATVSVVGKGSTEKEQLTISKQTKEALASWIAVRGAEPGPLFLNFDRSGKRGRLTGAGLYLICRAHGFRPHGLRHLAITEALDRTQGNVRAVRQFSRHRNVETLLIYDDNRLDIGGEITQLVADSDPD